MRQKSWMTQKCIRSWVLRQYHRRMAHLPLSHSLTSLCVFYYRVFFTAPSNPPTLFAECTTHCNRQTKDFENYRLSLSLSLSTRLSFVPSCRLVAHEQAVYIHVRTNTKIRARTRTHISTMNKNNTKKKRTPRASFEKTHHAIWLVHGRFQTCPAETPTEAARYMIVTDLQNDIKDK